MHNNFTLDNTPKPPKAFYTVVEAAIIWARSEGAKGAGDPRIAHYNNVILEAISSGSLRAAKVQPPGGMPDAEHASANSQVISLCDLREWFAKSHPRSRVKFSTVK